MLTTRSFRNEDPPAILTLWKKSQQKSINEGLVSLSMDTLQMQTLGMPFFDPHSIILAFDNGKPVGYIHTSLSPKPDGSDFDPLVGDICFLAVNPEYPDTKAVARLLLKEGEKYLLGLGVKKIFAPSRRPCLPFYLGLYGDSEPIAFFDSEPYLITAFQEENYHTHLKTYRYRLRLEDYKPPIKPITVGWRSELSLEFDCECKFKYQSGNTNSRPLTWLEMCCFANGNWLRVRASLNDSDKTIAQLYIRITTPDTEEYASASVAGLMDVKVHTNFRQSGVATHFVGETLRYITAEFGATRIEAHIDQTDVPMNDLLNTLQWKIIDTGTAFYKEF